MKVHIVIPYALDKNLGRAYNDAMQLIPREDWACFLDYDVQLLTPDAGTMLHRYAEKNPGAVLTCFTNRIHPLNTEQLLGGRIVETDKMKIHIARAEHQRIHFPKVTPVHNHFSGFLTLLSKETWLKCSFPENGGCLGVDTEWFKKLKAKGIPMLRMDGLYVWHTYRIMNGINNKTHLK